MQNTNGLAKIQNTNDFFKEKVCKIQINNKTIIEFKFLVCLHGEYNILV